MRFEDVSIEGKIIHLSDLDRIFNKLGFHRGEQSDYERVTYDRKFENLDTKEVFYLRVQGYAVMGDVDAGDAEIKLLTPLLGKHYYPHGVEYGEGENFPKHVVSKSKTLLDNAEKEIKSFAKA